MAGVRQLEQQSPVKHVKNQHVVSRVLLDEFTELRGKNQEMQLAGLDLTRVNSSPRYGGPKMFGKVPDFIKFASGSAEELWNETETKIRSMLDAVAGDTLFDNPAHLDVIRDTFVLHLVRSIPAAFIHDDAWATNRHLAHKFALQFPKQLDDIYYSEHGKHPSSPEELNAAADSLFAEMAKQKERGALFRFGLEDKFNRYRPLISHYGVEVFRSKRGEFLIGDAPALTIKYGRRYAGLAAKVGLLWADELVLPLGPKYLAVISRHGSNRFVDIPKKKAHKYNIMQIQSAYRHVHFRPSSGLEGLIRSTSRPIQYPEWAN
jgi:hypothetical protein